MAAPPSFSYTPPPEEQAYFAGLFSVADSTHSGYLAGKEAVTFMATSGVPLETLKNIWTMVDNPKTSSLDLAKFTNAVRLIQLHQNGQRPQDAALSTPPGVTMKLPWFEGISGAVVPLPGAPGGGAPPAAMAPSVDQLPPPQQQQQQQLQAPPSPSASVNPGMAAAADPAGSSMAMVAQDPYVMYPQEQSRYESLFPQYEVRNDGYVYGTEAVDLFSKSGADKGALRQIWTIVDQDPVDNRLSKLEFALCMHLIVCITKKNLPVPASLPPSLQMIKDQQTGRVPGGAIGGPPPLQAPPSPRAFQAPPSPGASMAIPSPQNQMAPPSPQQQFQQPPPAMPALGMPPPQPPIPQQQQQYPGPPPLAPVGGQSISDAFEGLSTDPTTVGPSGASIAAPPSPVAAVPPAVIVPPAAAPGMMEPVAPVAAGGVDGMPPPMPDVTAHHYERAANPVTAAATVAAVAAAPTANGSSNAKYELEDDHGELAKLQATLQKLQAENISLKARLGAVTEEEADVRKEIGVTVAEIGRLSQELTGLRTDVADAKAALIEATAELKSQKEKKGMISDLIDDQKVTLGALNEATEGIRDLQATDNQIEQQQQERNAAADAFGSGLFGGFDESAQNPYAPAPVPTPVPAQEEQGHVSAAPIAEPAPAADRAPVPEPAVANMHEVPSQPSLDYDAPPGAQPNPYAAPMAEPHPMGAPMGGAGPVASSSVLNSESFGHNSGMQQQSYNMAQGPSSDEIDDMKKQAAEFDRKAVEADDALRQLVNQVDSLRRDAEVAEVAAAEKSSAADGAKKKRFGKGGKKEAVKGAEAARAVALEKKKAVEAAQVALGNAQAESIKAKREADTMRQKVEEMELQAASAASMQPQPEQQHAMAVPPPQTEMNYGGYAMAPPPPMAESGGMGGQQMMGMQGGEAAPVPVQSDGGDYDNPFGGW